MLAFDNTNGIVTSVAVANVSSQTANIGYIIRDDTGAQIGSGTLASVAGKRPDRLRFAGRVDTGFPVTANKRGTVEFDTPAGGQISVLGIRNTPQVTAQGTVTTLTTVPALANVGTGGGSFAFIAAGGDGWQTTFVLVNAASSAAPVTLKFFDTNGNPLSLPLSFPQTGAVATESSSRNAAGRGDAVGAEQRGCDSADRLGAAHDYGQRQWICDLPSQRAGGGGADREPQRQRVCAGLRQHWEGRLPVSRSML